jgi:hypothetical protein
VSLKLFKVQVVETRKVRCTSYVLAEDESQANIQAERDETVFFEDGDVHDVVGRAISKPAEAVAEPDAYTFLYRVFTSDGESYDLPAEVWTPEMPEDLRSPYHLYKGRIITEGDVPWGDELWDKLWEVLGGVLPQDAEIVRVEVL